ncbi:MAG TPA: NAD-dependent epimerase/dehydratase family protein [Chitinophagales bacterium]|nr:NAD-dependent epimerase/dehydratase family protein [Chitinophagales bacterium]
MHTILGAGGVTAHELVKELRKNNLPYTLVSRNPKPVAGERWLAADLTDAEQVNEAVKGSSIVYLLAGTKYDIKVWREFWPKVMRITIEACKRANAKLIFFDNVYAYGLVKGPMMESTPYNPSSKKGEVRAKIATELMEETKRGNLQAIIACAADFYGPRYEKSFFNMMVMERLAKHKSAQWMVNAGALHSFTYTSDLGTALLLLANNPSSYNQIWHLPTASPVLTGKRLIEIAASAFNTKAKSIVLPKFMVSMAGIFDHNIKEAVEMLYQSKYDYIFDSSKFEKAFRVKATSYEDGLREAATSYK